MTFMKENWLSMVMVAAIGVGGGVGSTVIMDKNAELKLWTVEYFNAHVPPKEVLQRLESLDKHLKDHSAMLAQQSQSINELALGVAKIESKLEFVFDPAEKTAVYSHFKN
jgi:hypothetical protein